MAMNNGNIGDNHFGGGGEVGALTSLLCAYTLGTWIPLIPALIWDMDLLLVKRAVIPEAK